MSTTVGSAAEVGKTVVVQLVEQVMKQGGTSAAVDCAAGALSAAVGTLVVSLDEAAARDVINRAIDAALQYLAAEVRKGAH